MFSEKLDELSKSVQSSFGGLNAVQLNWKPNSSQWSIAQCLQHIIILNGLYLPALNKIITGQYKMNFWEKHNPMSKYTGRKMAETLGPVIKNKFKTPRIFSPDFGLISQDIIADFLKHQENLIKIYTELETGKYDHIILTSPVAPLITFPLINLMEVLVVHEERHIIQAVRVKDDSAFPG